jgi:hypothetical protein
MTTDQQAIPVIGRIADSSARRCSTIVGYMCGPRIYRFGGWLFERHAGYGTPWPIKEDGTPYKRAGRVFCKVIDRFERMSNEKREACREGGGCVPLIQSNATAHVRDRSEAEGT